MYNNNKNALNRLFGKAAFENNAISFGVESSYRDWETNFPAIIVCESKNMDRIQQVAEQ